VSENDYYIERDIDGHPICFGGIIQDKKTILKDLNDMTNTIRSLYKSESALQEQLESHEDFLEELWSMGAAGNLKTKKDERDLAQNMRNKIRAFSIKESE